MPGRARVAEDMLLGERHLADERQAVGVLLLGLAREPDHHVGGDRDLRHRRPHPLDQRAEVGRAVATHHPPQHRVRAALERQVEVATHPGLLPQVQEAVRPVLRLDRRDPDARRSASRPAARAASSVSVGPLPCAHPPRLAIPVRAVRADLDPAQHDLAVAQAVEQLDLVHDGLDRAAALRPARSPARCSRCSGCCSHPGPSRTRAPSAPGPGISVIQPGVSERWVQRLRRPTSGCAGGGRDHPRRRPAADDLVLVVVGDHQVDAVDARRPPTASTEA